MAADNDAVSSDSGRSGKLLVILLGTLSTIAAIAFLWLWLSTGPQMERQVQDCDRNLMRLKQLTESVAAQVDRIKSDRLEVVSVPSELIRKVATARGIVEHIKTEKSSTHPWRSKSSYEVVTTTVQFLKKMGYPLLDLVNLMQDIEKTNPKVQVSNINFGQVREEAAGVFLFTPVNMEVRVFNPRAR